MITPPPWYGRLERAIEPSFPLMVAIGLLIIAITAWLMLRGRSVPLAGWLVYLISP